MTDVPVSPTEEEVEEPEGTEVSPGEHQDDDEDFDASDTQPESD